MSTAPQSFDERLSRAPLWTLIPTVLAPVIVCDVFGPQLGFSAPAVRHVADLLVSTSAFGWWMLKATPRPYSVRASFGRPLDLAGWGVVALAMLGNTSVRIVWWIVRYCRDLLHVASLSGGYTFRLPHTPYDGIAVLNVAVLLPMIEELLFRGTIFRSCRARFGPTAATLLSSMLFGILHSDSVAVFISALTYALAYTRTRSLWAPIALHMLNNAGWLVLSKYYLGDRPQLRLEGPWQLGAGALVLLIGSGVWLQFLRGNWRTLDVPLPPDSLQALPVENSSSLPEPVHAR